MLLLLCCCKLSRIFNVLDRHTSNAPWVFSSFWTALADIWGVFWNFRYKSIPILGSAGLQRRWWTLLVPNAWGSWNHLSLWSAVKKTVNTIHFGYANSHSSTTIYIPLQFSLAVLFPGRKNKRQGIIMNTMQSYDTMIPSEAKFCTKHAIAFNQTNPIPPLVCIFSSS